MILKTILGLLISEVDGEKVGLKFGFECAYGFHMSAV